jgi:hypothetical protein
MPRDWTRDERQGRHERWDERDDARRAAPREDFGQADFSNDYGYDPERRAGYRVADETGERSDDYGQADYSTDYAYDRDRGRAYRRFAEDDGPPPRTYRDARGDVVGERNRSWVDRAGAFFGGRDEAEAPRRRRGPSDRVLWAVIVERLEDERGLDLRDLEVLVENAEVTLNGTVRRKEDKRRIEDIADLDGIRHVQNNLRVRERRWF